MGGKGYYIRLVLKDNLYYFQLWYRGKQEMGNSIGYQTSDECKKGLIRFKKILANNEMTEDNEFFKIVKLDYRKYVNRFFDKNRNELYVSRIINTRHNCIKSMLSTYRNLPYADIKL